MPAKASASNMMDNMITSIYKITKDKLRDLKHETSQLKTMNAAIKKLKHLQKIPIKPTR